MLRLALALSVLVPLQEKKKPDVYTKADDAGPDFAIQGEYEGSGHGVHVIAEGDGAFAAVLYAGGLPGAGWDGKTRQKAKGAAKEGVIHLQGEFDAVAGKGEMTVARSGVDFKLKRVERKSPTLGAKPPEGAVVLFDGTSAAEWKAGNGKEIAVVDGAMNMQGTGGANSKRKFGDSKYHIEFMLSFMPKARGQGRSNSGAYYGGRYETQILDSFGLEGKDNECGGIYSVGKPAVNMCLPPLQWQTYDVEYRAARWDGEGKKTESARLTVLHNGVKIHDNIEAPKATTAAPLKESPEPGFLHFQDHGNPVFFRNIWVVEVK